MYSAQALWTQARENLDVVNVVFSNWAYLILYAELHGAGREPGPSSNNLFRLDRPSLDWVALANAMGVEAGNVETLEGFADLFRAACGRRGPFLIEFRIS
jgi:acetolactate synthase-1/2/3 large subunit